MSYRFFTDFDNVCNFSYNVQTHVRMLNATSFPLPQAWHFSTI